MYHILGQPFEPDPSQKIGGGSEGTVYRLPANPLLCAKIFHPPDRGDREALDLARYRAKKVRAICRSNIVLPDRFILPKNEVLDGRGSVVGFSMARVPAGYHKLKALMDQTFRLGNGLGLREVLELAASSFEDLAIIHGKKLVLGDVNLGCRLFTNDLQTAWVDTDSWSYPGFPCIATTEMFAHPELYPNLTTAGKYVTPQPHHDRFSFTLIMLMLALQGVHPFRMGAHRSVHSLQERTSQGITAFDAGVAYPKYLTRPEILSDELLEAVLQVLKRKTTKELAPAMLRQFISGIVDCPRCNTQFHNTRSACPVCQEKVTIDVARLAALAIEEVVRTPGVILFAQVISQSLHMVCRVNDTVHLVIVDDAFRTKTISTPIPATPGARYRFFGSYLVVCSDPFAETPVPLNVYRINRTSVEHLETTTTAQLLNAHAVFDCSDQHLYRIAGNSLIRASVFNERFLIEDRIAQVHRSQSWFTVDRDSGADREFIIGYDRALRERDWQWFVVSSNPTRTSFSYHEVNLKPLRSNEKLDDFTIYFRASAALLVRKTTYRGKAFVRYSIIGLDGSVQTDEVIASDDEAFEHWESLQGKLLQKESILHVTPKGVVKQSLTTGTYSLLGDTESFITTSDRLFSFSGRVGVVRRNGILTITKKAAP